jgi:hypothetical protein
MVAVVMFAVVLEILAMYFNNNKQHQKIICRPVY